MDKKEKTILLPIFNAIRARDFFRTDIYRVLVKAPGIKLVIVTPSYKVDFYKAEFGEPNVIFEPWDKIYEPKLGKALNGIAFTLLNTGTIKKKLYQVYMKDGNFLKYYVRLATANVLGNKPILRRFVRFLDRFVPLNLEVACILDKYKPDVVVVPDIILPADRVFLRAAKRMGIFVIGMVRSWDNLTAKGVIQVLPDKLIAQTNYMKQDAIKYGDMPAENIAVLGVPQFDIYYKPRNIARSEFLKNLGIPENRRVLLCAPFFDVYSTASGIKIINGLARAIDSGRLPKDLHLLVRYRPESMPDDFSEEKLLEHPNITVTLPYSKGFSRGLEKRPDYEFSSADVELLTNSIYFSDVTMNTISTLTVDAIALDRPVINIRFDGDPATPPAYRVALYAGYDHYNFIENAKAVRLAYDMNELINQVNDYLRNNKLDAEGRKVVRDAQIEFTDGKSGSRFAEYILTFCR